MVPLPSMSASYTQQALTSAALELKYTKNNHLIDIISKDEDVRQLRFEIHVLEDDNDELREQLVQEQDRSDAFEKLVKETLLRAEDAEAREQDLEAEIRQREQELQALEAEKNALQHTTEDATAALTEKLALTRELSVLKPELEHLKAQAASTEALMTEKLALQRQLTEVQCEVENAKREAKRALAKRRNTGVELAQEEQMDDLKRQLEKEKRARRRLEDARKSVDGDGDQEEIRKQLEKERRRRQKAEEQLEAAQDTTQIEEVRKDLLREKNAKSQLEETVESLQAELERQKKAAARAAKRADGNAKADDEAEELRSEIARVEREKGKLEKEKSKIEREKEQQSEEHEALTQGLNEKLNDFRKKLRSTKEKLKEKEAELAEAKEAASAAQAAACKKTAAPKATAAKAATKKRNAAQMDPDATTLGTPGDGPVAKRSRKPASNVGEKSMFSMTPLLNKTASMIQDHDDEAEASDAETAAVNKKKKQPLAQQPASKANVPPKKAPAQRKQKMPALEMVTEEHEPAEKENASKPAKPQTLKVKTKTADGPANDVDPTKKKPKQRKSLADFASFNPQPDVERRQKKRKLGGLGKTLFDEEEAEAPGPLKRGLFGTKGLGLLGAKKGGGVGSSFLGGSRAGTTLLTAGDGSGFQFSPLKKARRNLDDTLRG